MNHSILLDIATRAMLNRGLEPAFPPNVLLQLAAIQKAPLGEGSFLPDLSLKKWCSIDNDDSRDLDQLTLAEKLPSGVIKIWVAVADVDALVKIHTPLDQHAEKNTTSVYTGVKVFPMLPERLSTDLTSLSQNEERLAIVIEMEIDPEGRVAKSNVYRALVKNWAKLTYHGVSAWLMDSGPLPGPASRVPGMDEQLKLQDEAARRMRSVRHEHGALELETIEAQAVMKDDTLVDLRREPKNRAGELIEDFMIAANGVTATFLAAHQFPTFRRVVKAPEKWDRIVAVAKRYGEDLPAVADSKALALFLSKQRLADPLRFPDLSLTIVKLLGQGVYVVNLPGQAPTGHFGLAVRDYSHSTAPNRRFPDLITQRLLKAVLEKSASPYSFGDLQLLATHCTEQEDAANKVERQVKKSAAALLLSSRLGEIFPGIVTGASEKGVWARIFSPPVEGKIVQAQQGLEVGDRVQVKLLEVNVPQGWIDFARVDH